MAKVTQTGIPSIASEFRQNQQIPNLRYGEAILAGKQCEINQSTGLVMKATTKVDGWSVVGGGVGDSCTLAHNKTAIRIGAQSGSGAIVPGKLYYMDADGSGDANDTVNGNPTAVGLIGGLLLVQSSY